MSLPIYFFIISLAGAILCFKTYRSIADIFLLFVIVYIGWQISLHTWTDYDKNNLYLLHCRCEEKLTHNNYILSTRHQKFFLSHFHTNTQYRIGDSLVFCAHILPVHKSTNPGEFDFARYLKQKEVYHQVVPFSDIQLKGHSHTLLSVFSGFRERLLSKTNKLTEDTICRQLIHALCLGYKNDLNPEFRNLFIDTGTVHILSVSGLHTGAIFLLLIFLFKIMGLSGKKMSLGVIPLLWAYACLTGLAPSTVRASTILSFITFGKAFSRTYTPINSLAASAFFTLLVQPSTLYSLSFLLSYSAYTGILLLYPFFYQWGTAWPSLFSKIYACCCLTISAQLPTLPLSAFYFHTVNINGFLTNIIAIPLATLFLYSSAFCLFLPAGISQYLIVIPELLSRILVFCLNTFAPYIVNLKELYPSSLTIILIYGCLLTLGSYILLKKRYWLKVHLLCLCLLFYCLVATNLYLSSQAEIVILHHKQESDIVLNYKGYYTFLAHTCDSSGKATPYIRQNKLKALPVHTGVTAPMLWWQKPYLYWKKDTILIADRQVGEKVYPDILIVTQDILPHHLFTTPNSPKYPRLIIADGSNRKYTLQEWQEFCESHNINFQNTSEIGSICLPLK